MPQIKDKEKKDKKVLIKMSLSEYEKAKTQADKYTDGNISRWIRYSSSKLEPRKEDLKK